MIASNGIKKSVLQFFSKGHERTIRAKRNIAASLAIKSLNILINLMLVPLTINYLDPTRYGIWITLTSIIGWFAFFDIGLGHGLRNRFAEARAAGEHQLARVYVSTTYAILILIMVFCLVSFFIVNPIVNWNNFLNVDQDIVLTDDLRMTALILFTFLCFRLVFTIISILLIADESPATASFLDLLGNSIALLLVYILTKNLKGSLFFLALGMSCPPALVLLVASAWFYKNKYQLYIPSLNHIDFSKARDLLSLGVRFFAIQIAAVLLYQTNNIIISKLLGPSYVTPYSVAFKYFGSLLMVFSIVVAPFWSSFTQAWVKKDILWIKNIISKLLFIWGALIIICIIMVLLSNVVYGFWIGHEIVISFSTSALVGLFFIIYAWNSIYSTFLNGVGEIQLQLYVSICSAIINVPLAIYFGLRLGLNGILLANILISLPGIFIYRIQYVNLVKAQEKYLHV